MNRQSVGRRTRYGRVGATSLRAKGEVQTDDGEARRGRETGGAGSEEQAGPGRDGEPRAEVGKRGELRGSVQKRRRGAMGWVETEWWEGRDPESGRPVGEVKSAGVRASVGARKPGNAGGAKGRRKVDG